jgi:hypothetical protein
MDPETKGDLMRWIVPEPKRICPGMPGYWEVKKFSEIVRMKTLVTIMAHRDAQETFNRHFNLWFGLGHDLLIACPQRQSVKLPEWRGGFGDRQINTLEVGKAEHSGVNSIIRLKTILEHMNGMGYERYAFLEYDALILGKKLPLQVGDVMGPIYRDNGADRGFEGTMFIHPPILFTAAGLAEVVRIMQGMPLTAEKSVWDRWLGYCIESSHLQWINAFDHGLAFTMNTIHPDRYEALFEAVKLGATLVHGVKTEECLRVCLEARALRDSVEHVMEHNGEVTWKEKEGYQIS